MIWTDGRYNEDLPGDFFNTDITKDIDKSATKPVIQHEFRWWSSFPDVRIAPKYSGAIRPYAAEMAQDAARRQGIDHILAQAAANSQRLQLIEAKGKMEACRRDWPALAGISHFNAMDANPSPQGIIDEFYERKCTDADTWIQTNGDTVVLCSLGFDNRVLAAGDTFRCALYVSDYAHPPFENPILKWSLATENGGVASGRIVYRHEPFKTCSAGEIECDIPEVTRPTTARLSVRLHDRRQALTNMWDLWLFPRIPGNVPGVTLHGPAQYTWLKTVEGIAATCEGTLPAPQEAMVLTERIDPTITAFMQDGGRVLLAASEGLVRPFSGKLGLNTGRYFFTPPANYPPYESGHDGTIVKEHPMFGEFPHEGFADLQFYRMLAESPPLDLAPLGLTEGDPVIRAIHSYPVCRPLGYLVEGMVGEGRLILCALDLDQSWPEARYLLRQLCRYLANGPHQKVPAISQVCLEQVVAATAIP